MMKKHNRPKNLLFPAFDHMNWWGPAQLAAFDLLKQLFISYPVLRNPDPTKRYILDTDASQFAVGAQWKTPNCIFLQITIPCGTKLRHL